MQAVSVTHLHFNSRFYDGVTYIYMIKDKSRNKRDLVIDTTHDLCTLELDNAQLIQHESGETMIEDRHLPRKH